MFNSLITILILLFFISSCENTRDKKIFGQIVGAAVGGYLGSKVGSGAARDISTILGGAAGYILGGKIIELLSENEKKEFNNVIEDSLNYNADNVKDSWNSSENDNTSGEVIPLKSYKIKKKSCRDFKKIIKKDGKSIEENSTACRGDDGNWILI